MHRLCRNRGRRIRPNDKDLVFRTVFFLLFAVFAVTFVLLNIRTDWRSPSVAYLQSKGKNLGTIGTRNYDDEDILKYVDVGATYYFNKNMSTYVDYKINLLDDNQFTRDAGINTDNIVALGLVYQF